MKQSLFLALIITLLGMPALAQKSEVSAVLSSGLFSFTGKATAASSIMSYDDGYGTGYTYNPYGTKNGFCDGLALNFKRISKSRFLFGLEAGLEQLRSKTGISRIDGYHDTSTYERSASGRTYLTCAFLNLSPFIGYRRPVRGVVLDASFGVDIAYNLSLKESGKATDDAGREYRITHDRQTTNGDIRPRFQLSAYYRRYGAYVGYAIGMSSYITAWAGASSTDCSSRLIRFGLSYRLN